MDKKMTAILGTAFVLIVLFFVYILIPKDPTTKVNRESTKNNNQNIVNNNKEVDNIPPVVTNNVQNDVFVPTDLDLSSVTLEEVDEEITTEEILKIYEVNGPNGKVTFKLPFIELLNFHRTKGLSLWIQIMKIAIMLSDCMMLLLINFITKFCSRPTMIWKKAKVYIGGHQIQNI